METASLKAFIARARVPFLLFLAEINLTIILIRNLKNFFELTVFIYGDTLEMMLEIGLLVLAILNSLLVINTMFGLPSSRRGSWRSTVRKLLALVPITIILEVTHYTYSPIRTELVLIMTFAVILIMMLPSIRRYHTPYLSEVPPIISWLKAIIILPDRSASYRFVYEDERRAPPSETREG